MRRLTAVVVLGLVVSSLAKDYIVAPKAQGVIVPPTKEWVAKIKSLAPDSATAAPVQPRRILVFSLATGFQHTVKPHVVEAVKVLGDKTGAFEVVVNDDIGMFKADELKAFDAVVLNNVCPKGPRRDLFYDAQGDDRMTAQMEASLLDYVNGGGGLAVIHGAIAFQNNSIAISEMVGGSFDFHPARQTLTLELVDPTHPLVAGFGGKGFIHEDEPYLFKNAYAQKNFRPLLEIDISKLDEKTRGDKRVAKDIRYVAWIKKHGKGRVFYCSPSHQPESYETAAMLRFLLDGIQYALGDLSCDDSPAGSD